MLRDTVREAIQHASGVENIKLLTPKHADFGDYAVNMHQLTSQNAELTAENIIEKLSQNELFEKITQEGTFVNIRLKNHILLDEMSRIITEKDNYGSSKTGDGKTIIIEYSSPNIAKRFGIGHLRSTIIGQALYNLYEFLGWNVIGDNHLGDWGTQFGKMIVAIRKWADKEPSKLTIAEMEQLYVKFHDEAEKDDSLDDEARLAFKKLEDGNEAERNLWEQIVKTSMKEFDAIYKTLGVKIENTYGESSYEDLMPSIIEKSKNNNISKKSDGATVIPFPDENMVPGMLLKSDGGTTYFTRDLATIEFRKNKWNPDRILYEVGAEQAFHFRQVFWASELLNIESREKLIHVAHGLIRLKDGKMSTRKGKTIKLDEVLEKAIERARKLNKNDKVARMVGVGAIKYNDLKRSPKTGYVFDWDEILNLEGNSGPYIQYVYVRCNSILSKAGTSPKLPLKTPKLNKHEESVIRHIHKFPQVIADTAEKYSPNILCEFLFELSQKYNTFYNEHSILDASTEEEKHTRVLITASVAQVIKNGLILLGIDTPDKM